MHVILIGGGGAVGRDLTLAFGKLGISYDLWERDYYTLRGARFRTGEARIDDIADTLSARGRLWINLAGLGDAYQCDRTPSSAVELNVELATRYSRLASTRGMPLLHVSTWEVYGSGHGVADEDASCRPTSIYAHTKYMGEAAAVQIGGILGNPVAAIRIGPVMGPSMRQRTALRSFADAAFAGRPLHISSGGMQVRQFVDYRDLARAVLAFARADRWNHLIYNVAPAAPVSILELAQLVLAMHPGMELVESNPRRLSQTASRSLSIEYTRNLAGSQKFLSKTA